MDWTQTGQCPGQVRTIDIYIYISVCVCVDRSHVRVWFLFFVVIPGSSHQVEAVEAEKLAARCQQAVCRFGAQWQLKLLALGGQ